MKQLTLQVYNDGENVQAVTACPDQSRGFASVARVNRGTPFPHHSKLSQNYVRQTGSYKSQV